MLYVYVTTYTMMDMMAELERPVWVTAVGGVDHAVTQRALATALRAGQVEGLCGARFVAAPMIADPGPRCSRCARYARARATLRSAEERLGTAPRHRRESVMRRTPSGVSPSSISRVSSPAVRGGPGGVIGSQARRDCGTDSPRPSGSQFRRAPAGWKGDYR